MERKRLNADGALRLNEELGKTSGKQSTRTTRKNAVKDDAENAVTDPQQNAVNGSQQNAVDKPQQNTVDITRFTTGRPSKYDPKYCELVLKMGAEGKSITAIANAVGVHRDTLYTWATNHTEFSDTLKLAMQLAEEHWENKGIKGMDAATKEFNANLWKFWMSCRFPENYREVKGTELSTPPGRPVQTQDIPATPEEAARHYKTLMD